MKNSRRFWFFIAVAIFQLAAPLYVAWHGENVLTTGQRFFWTTAPLDPYDPFQGRYIDLQFTPTAGPVLTPEKFTYGQTAYAIIGQDSEGRAVIRGISSRPPTITNYVKVKINYVDNGIANVQLPFTRYYLPEEAAPAAESAYRENVGSKAVAAVRIKDGYAVVEELFIDGQPLADYLRQNLSK